MSKYAVDSGTGERVAKRMLKLAWDASSCVGMGFLQDRGEVDEAEVWKQGCRRLGVVNADYLNGRMMKLGFEYGDDFIKVDDDRWRPDYQSFCRQYATAEALLSAALASLTTESRVGQHSATA